MPAQANLSPEAVQALIDQVLSGPEYSALRDILLEADLMGNEDREGYADAILDYDELSAAIGTLVASGRAPTLRRLLEGTGETLGFMPAIFDKADNKVVQLVRSAITDSGLRTDGSIVAADAAYQAVRQGYRTAETARQI